MASVSSTALSACYSALRRGLLRSSPQAVLDKNGYVSEIRQNLIEGVYLSDFETDVRQGDGNELKSKFRAAHSSTALAVNTFAPFKRNETNKAALRLPNGSDFVHLQFERKCSAGILGRKPPNLDFVAEGPNSVVAIESKCTEHLSEHIAAFSSAYDEEILDERRESTWFREMHRLLDHPQTYRWLNAAQLVKHAFGLSLTFRGQVVTLLYLFWEPTNPDQYSEFAEHREEIDRFAESVAGSMPRFSAMSYPELWKCWDTYSEPDWLTHVARLRARYEIDV